MDLRSRKITHLAYQEPFEGGIADYPTIRGLVEGATTKAHIVLLLPRFRGDLAAAQLALANDQEACDAVWLHDNAFQKLVDELPEARKPKAYVDFGDPHRDSWAN